jgi:signal recognition particle receptor subunit alpha
LGLKEKKDSKTGKAARRWDGAPPTSEEVKALDFSSSSKENIPVSTSHLSSKASMGTVLRDGTYIPQDLIDLMGSAPQAAKKSDQPPTFFSNMLRMVSTSHTMTEKDLLPVLQKMENHLVSKNVAAEVARGLMSVVGSSLSGKKVGWATMYQHIRRELILQLERILLPSSGVDLLRDIQQSKKQGNKFGARPFVITFCGVNGVGKSTNLAKISYWLLRNNLSVLIAACDTFRSGAVEQLRMHVRNLTAVIREHGNIDATIQVFERGYGKDASTIAKDAISFAQKEGIEVVLIDTAGRMQDNEPLMRSLAKVCTCW